MKLEGPWQLDTYNFPAFSLHHLGVYQCDDLSCAHVKFPRWNASGLGGSVDMKLLIRKQMNG